MWNTKFVGNTIASDDRLRTQISTSRPFLWLFGGEFDRKKLDEDVEKLTAYYRGLGFFRARIGREIEFNEKQNWVTITFVIDEGPRYKIRNVSVIGNTKYTNDELLADLKLKQRRVLQPGEDDRRPATRCRTSTAASATCSPTSRPTRGSSKSRANSTWSTTSRRATATAWARSTSSHQGRVSAHATHHGAEPPFASSRATSSTSARSAPASGGLRASQLFEANPANGQRPEDRLQPAGPGGDRRRQPMTSRRRSPAMAADAEAWAAAWAEARAGGDGDGDADVPRPEPRSAAARSSARRDAGLRAIHRAEGRESRRTEVRDQGIGGPACRASAQASSSRAGPTTDACDLAQTARRADRRPGAEQQRGGNRAHG